MPIRRLCALLLVAGCGAWPTARRAGKSEIAFTMKQMGVNFDGRFRKWKADIVFQPAALDQSKADVDVDLASLDLASAESEAEAQGSAMVQYGEVSGRAFRVDVDQEPRRRPLRGRRQALAEGHHARLRRADRREGRRRGNRVAEGTFSLKRLEYKIGEGEWADTATVDNDIRVRVRMVLQPGT